MTYIMIHLMSPDTHKPLWAEDSLKSSLTSLRRTVEPGDKGRTLPLRATTGSLSFCPTAPYPLRTRLLQSPFHRCVCSHKRPEYLQFEQNTTPFSWEQGMVNLPQVPRKTTSPLRALTPGPAPGTLTLHYTHSPPVQRPGL